MIAVVKCINAVPDVQEPLSLIVSCLCALQVASLPLDWLKDGDKRGGTVRERISITRNVHTTDKVPCTDSSPTLVSLVLFSLPLSPLESDAECELEAHCAT